MAKDVSNEEDDDQCDKMDEESLGFLEQVKKGKPRNFVLSMKGNKVRSLLVKKKSIKDNDRKQARGGGFQPIFGVATGTGLNITFTVARSDGFNDKTAGIKTEKLKKFLKEQTGTAYKPQFQLVDAPLAVPFDDEDLSDPLIARFMQLETLIEQACAQSPGSVPQIQSSVNSIRILLQDEETRPSAAGPIDNLERDLRGLLAGEAPVPPPPPPAPDSAPPPPESAPAPEAATLFKTRLAGLLPQIKAVAGTPAGDDAKLKASAAGGFARKQDYAQANALLDEVETLLTAGDARKASAAPVDTAALATKLAEALKKLKPLMDRVVSTQPGRQGELHATMAQIVSEIKSKQFEQARQNVTDFATLLKSLAAQPTAEATPSERERPDAREVKWSASFAKVEPIVLDALRTNPFGNEAGLAEFRKAWEWAVNCAADGDYDKALAALPKVLELLKVARTSGTSAPVADVNPEVKPFAEARLNWRSTRGAMGNELKKLQDAIANACRGNDELQIVVDHVADLTGYLARLDERLEDKLDDIVNAEAGQTREKLKNDARKLLDEYQQELNRDFFREVDSENGFINVAIASTAKSTLAEISRVLS